MCAELGEHGQHAEQGERHQRCQQESVARLDVKSKSKMSDADLYQYFNSELQKKDASNCDNCDCDCLAILTNGQVGSAILRYLSWFWQQPSKYDRDCQLLSRIACALIDRTKGCS